MRFEKNVEERYATLTILEDRLNSIFAPIMKEEILLLNTMGSKNIILNLKNVQYIDSSGLSVLLRGNSICDNSDGYFVICNPSEHVTKLINISQLQSVLNIATNEEEAIEAIFAAELESELSKEIEKEKDTKSTNN
jgi:anti-anti-sigma factor